MKHLFLFCGLFLTSIGYAQNVDLINKLKPSVSPQSPQVAALSRFGDHPVNLSTGIPSINVPIYEISAGSVKIPVSLDYHAGGNRISDIASWVGLGWALNAGGGITRSVIGRPDELAELPLVLPTISLSPPPNTNALCETTFNDLESLDKKEKDSGYDIFSLSIPGKNLKFVLLPDAASGSMATTMPYERIKIEYERNSFGWFKSFKVTDENGIVYTFDKAETTDAGNGTYNSAWQLSEIQGTRPIDKVKFNYLDYSHSTYTDFADTQTITSRVTGVCSDNQGTTSFRTSQVYSSFFSWLPNEIIFPGGKITFITSATFRTDLFSSPSGSKSLDKIELRGWDVVNNTYSLIKIFDLQQSYFTPVNPIDYSYLDGPLRLDGVIMRDGSNTMIGKYQFGYKTDIALPGPQSKKRDSWGFYNDKPNTTLIPSTSVEVFATNNTSSTVVIGGANREPSEQHMQAWILNSIVYPTGGVSRFFYEANRYSTPNNTIKLAGGLRINRIETQSSSVEPIRVKSFKYGQNENSYGQLNQELRAPAWVTSFMEMVPPNCTKTTTVFGSYPTASLNSIEGNLVTYDEVTEYEGAYLGNTLIADLNGKTVYQFRNTPDGQVAVPKAPQKNFIISRHWERGLLEKKTVYRKVNTGLFAPVLIQTNSYTNLIGSQEVEGPVIGMATAKILSFSNEWMASSAVVDNQAPEFYTNICSKVVQSYANPVYYKWRKGNMQLYKSEEITFPTPTSSYSIPDTTKQETSFNINFLPKESISYESDGSETHKQIRYAGDFLVSTTLTPTAFSKGIRLLNNKYMQTTVIEEVTFRKRKNEEARLVNGKLTLYSEFSTLTGWPFASEVHTLDVQDGCCLLSSLTSTTFLSGSMTKDSRYSLANTFNSYDSNGNLLKYTLRNKVPTQLTWQTSSPSIGTFVSANSVLQTETLNPGSTPTLTTQYAYKIPLIGVKSVTNPTGIMTQYEYDPFGRLSNIKDNNGNKVKSYEYNFRPQFTVVYPINGPTITVNRPMTFTIPSSTFSNPSNQAITYNFTGLPSGLVSQGSLLSGTPTVTGTSTVTIVASTPDGQNATTSFSINVITPQPLTILSPSYGCFTGDLIFRSLGGTAGAIEYLAAGISNWTSQAGGHNYRPNLGDGPVTIFARNTDAPSNVVTYSWDWKNQCRDFNQSPSINVSMASPQSATLNQPYSYTLPTNLFSDPEGQPLVYSVTGLPSGITYNGGTRISGVPSLTGVFTISVKATDAYDLATTAQYSLSIVPSNTVSLPVLTPFGEPVLTGGQAACLYSTGVINFND